MGARILDLATARHQFSQESLTSQKTSTSSRGVAQLQTQTVACQRATVGINDTIEHFEFWCGASRRHYVHTVYDLFDCPELPQANYLLVRRSEDGQREVLQIGRTVSNTGSLNLAKIRQNAACLGANEVHVHLLPDTDKARNLVEFDLRAGQFGNLAAEPAASISFH